MRFENKVAIVTGAASGIGLATALRLGSEGARVVIADLDAAKCEQAADQVKAAGAPDAWGSACDVSQEAQVIVTVQGAIERFGRLDVIVNNAGLMIFKPLEEHTAEDWLKVLSVDLLGAFFFHKQAFLRMKAGGAIVNVSSVHALETTPHVASYAAAKAALLSLTRSAAIEGKLKGLRVNAVLPGAIDTPMLWDNPNIKAGLEAVNKADVGKPEDLAAVIAYLASDDAAFVQGASWNVDGGRLDQL
jgi:meso-butanediol dehydrogenase/(S,S)-butanediol dehydrogenase/diacetyl reductase